MKFEILKLRTPPTRSLSPSGGGAPPALWKCDSHPRSRSPAFQPFLPLVLLFTLLAFVPSSSFAQSAASSPVLLGDSDLAEYGEILRNQFRRITPDDIPLVQDIGTLPAAFDLFSPVWADAPAIRSVTTWLVPFSFALENGFSVLRDANGSILWSGSVDFSRPESSNVTLVGSLAAEEDFPLYEALREEIAGRIAPPPVPRFLLPTDTLRFTAAACGTNGVFQLEIASPVDGPVEIFARTVTYTSSVVTVVWTNDENTVLTNDFTHWNALDGDRFHGASDIWTCLGTAIVANGTAAFSDPAAANDSRRACFYLAQPFADSDSDGLSDASERWTFHTDPHSKDSDGDGWTDGEEAQAGTDPRDRLSAPRLARGVLLHAVKYGGVAASRWLQLHCSGPRPVDLSGFRLQSAGASWQTQVVLPPNTWLAPGHFLLVGGTEVTNADISATLDLSASLSQLPTAGIRLLAPEGSINAPVDVLVYGTHVPFNEQNLDVTGWLDSTTNLWAAASRHLERRRLGLDSDHESDWRHRPNASVVHDSSAILDSDGDGLTDEEEYTGVWTYDIETDPLDWDSDGDGLSDGYELRNGLDPTTPDSDGNGIDDGDELADGTQSHAAAQIHQGVTVDWTPSNWIMGSSIGADGEVTFTVTDIPEMGVWVVLREGGHTPEAMTWSVENARVAYSAARTIDDFPLVFLWLIPTNGTSCVLSVSDAGNGQVASPEFQGPDVTAHFMAIDAKLHWNWEPVSWNSYQRLSATPSFPNCFVSLSPDFNDWDECRVSWQLQIAYARDNHDDTALFPPEGPAIFPPGTWFDFYDFLGDTILGGTATVFCYPPSSSTPFSRVFYIRGTNPSSTDVEDLFADEPWYALGILRHECGYHGTYLQFNESGTLGPAPTDVKWCPNWGAPHGWGLMQLDNPPATAVQLWDWRANIEAGLTRIAEKRQLADTHLQEQIRQQQEDNPEDTIASHVFTIGGVDFQEGTSRTPLDACTIQAYNSATHFVIYWKRKTTSEPGAWMLNPTQTEYIENVLDCLEMP